MDPAPPAIKLVCCEDAQLTDATQEGLRCEFDAGVSLDGKLEGGKVVCSPSQVRLGPQSAYGRLVPQPPPPLPLNLPSFRSLCRTPST